MGFAGYIGIAVLVYGDRSNIRGRAKVGCIHERVPRRVELCDIAHVSALETGGGKIDGRSCPRDEGVSGGIDCDCRSIFTAIGQLIAAAAKVGGVGESR